MGRPHNPAGLIIHRLEIKARCSEFLVCIANKNSCYYRNGQHKPDIQVDIVFNYIFRVGLQEHVYIQVREIRLVQQSFKHTTDICQKTNMKHVVQYDAHLAIVFMVSTCVITY